jgi:hypothetical protein
VARRFAGIGHNGTIPLASLPSHGDEDDCLSERKPLASAPALSERRHRCFARRGEAVRGATDVAVVT